MVDLEKLRALVELSRLGTMSAVADATGYGTSAVSQQLAGLERQLGVDLLEAHGRRVRLTPAGRRLAAHGKTILAAVTAAQLDLAEQAAPSGVVRVAAYGTAMRRHLIPALAEIADRYPTMSLELQEYEPPETLTLLDDDGIDVGFVYDYTLVPRVWRHPHTLLSTSRVVLAVPADAKVADRISEPSDLDVFRDTPWIANSRDTGDDELAARLCALAGWAPDIRHRADDLDLVADLVLAGQGVSVLPAESQEAKRVRTVALELGNVERRMWSVTRAGTQTWRAATALIELVRSHVVSQYPADVPLSPEVN